MFFNNKIWIFISSLVLIILIVIITIIYFYVNSNDYFISQLSKEVTLVDVGAYVSPSCPVSACPPGMLRTMQQDKITMEVKLKATEDALRKGDRTVAGENYATFNRMVRTRIFFDGEYPKIFDKNENGVSDAWEPVLNLIKQKVKLN